MTDTKYYYRFGNEDFQTGFLWSGSISSDKPVTVSEAKDIIRKRNNIKRLPARTLVVSALTLQGKA